MLGQPVGFVAGWVLGGNLVQDRESVLEKESTR